MVVCVNMCRGMDRASRPENHSAISGDAAELSAATCSMKGRNLPLKVITTRFSPSLPVVVPTSWPGLGSGLGLGLGEGWARVGLGSG